MLYLGPIIAFLAVFALIPLARKIAIRMDFVDAPGGRKTHAKPVPPVGGLVIFPVYFIAIAALGVDISRLWALLAGIAALLVTGALDEKKHLNPWLKFFIQLGVTFLVVLYGEAQIKSLGNLFGFGDFWLSFMSVPFSVAAVMLLINAINLMDGMDGLAAGYGFVVLFWLMAACAFAGDAERMMAIGPLMGALAGFLYFNMRSPLRRKASVFLGDAGSMGMGLALAYFCIALAQHQSRVIAPVSVAWLLALPIMDTCAQFYRRVREGKHPFAPDRGHFHHHFIHAGISAGAATATILSLVFIAGGAGYLVMRTGIPEVVLTISWIGALLAHMAFSRRPEAYIGFLSKFAQKRLEKDIS